MTEKPIVLAVASDLHVGSTVGLCPPIVQLDDGGSYRSSKGQRWLWSNWQNFTGQAIAKAEAHKAKLITVFNGDITEGNHHHTVQVITENPATQMKLSYRVIADLVEASESVYVVRGTPAHVGRGASLEEKIADDLTNISPDDITGAASWWHLPIDVNGTLFDFAHHGKLGRLPWTKPNAINSIAAQMIVRRTENGGKIPDVVIRSHLHQYADTGTNYATIRVIATPGWQLTTGYVHRLQPGALGDIGGLIFTCWPKGQYELEVVRYRPKQRTPERIRT